MAGAAVVGAVSRSPLAARAARRIISHYPLLFTYLKPQFDILNG